jgi:hypothetical protein
MRAESLGDWVAAALSLHKDHSRMVLLQLYEPGGSLRVLQNAGSDEEVWGGSLRVCIS